MNLFDQVKDQLGATLGNSSQTPSVVRILTSLLGEQSGGLHQLLGALQSHGLGSIVESWISKGSNQPVDPEQLQHALGADRVQTLANELGLAPHAVMNELAQWLPRIVDALTPEGKLPQQTPTGSSLIQTLLGALRS
jgi:uncharacterized protein YidB (DUF937 family)